MGLLNKGIPLTWKEIVPHVEHIKKHGITQFINIYNQQKSRKGDLAKWGDETEYTIVKFDRENRKVRVCCKAEKLLDKLKKVDQKTKWNPEFGSYMIEGLPGVPYGAHLSCFKTVESDMKERRNTIKKLLEDDESILSISFPSLGVPDFTYPKYPPTPESFESGNSIFWPEKAIFLGHPRFKNLSKNIKARRGGKVAINVPIFKDKNTPSPYIEDLSAFGSGDDIVDAKPDHIYMDHMGFGMGMCCLQVTFQAANVDEARWLYDQLTPITPILLALSAATPIFRGKLSDVDSRWNIISASVDDRRREERGLEPLKNSKWVIPKSRYDSTDCYIYPCSVGYNDIPLQYDESMYQQLIDGNIDEPLAKHIAHMFIRDPHQVFRERIEQDDEKSYEHFETIQSSNWMNMRFKPPPVDAPEIGWRVEFRPTEVQLTDFENAAYCCFVVLLTRMIISFRLTYLMPISMVTENMKRAQQRDAVLNQKFWFRKSSDSIKSEYLEMSIAEILNGKEDKFIGIVPLMRKFLKNEDIDLETYSIITEYLDFISKRATGEIPTLAHWMRKFVQSHEAYKHDSDVNDMIVYDLLTKMDEISNKGGHCTKLLGNCRMKKLK